MPGVLCYHSMIGRPLFLIESTMKQLLFLLLCSPLYAQPPLTITDSGYYITVVEAGVPTYVELTQVTDLTKNSPDPPPVPKPPIVDKVIVDQVVAWSSALKDPDGAQALAIVYKTVYNAKLETPWQSIKSASVASLTLIKTTADWESFRAKVSALITKEAQQGTLDDALVINSVQHGLELSADGSPSLSIDVITKIIDLTQGMIVHE